MGDLHHPAPRLPEGWKQFQADNIDVTTISDVPTNSSTTGTGRHSRSPSVLSNHGGYSNSIQPSQTENLHRPLNSSSISNPLLDDGDDDDNDDIYGNSTDRPRLGSILDPQFPSEQQQQQQMSHFQTSSDEYSEFHNPHSELRNSSVNSTVSYFGPHDTAAHHTHLSSATQQSLNGIVPENQYHHRNANSNTANNIDEYYLSSTDPSSSPFLNPTTTTTDTTTFPGGGRSSTSPPAALSAFTTYQTDSFDQNTFQPSVPTYDNSTLDTNTLGLHWSHHRSRSDQSDISSNAASPFIGSVHSDHGSPFIHPHEPDSNTLEDDLHEALLGLDMGAPQFDVAAQYNPHNYDTSNLELDNSGFPLDAPLFPSNNNNNNNTAADRQEQQYYEQQQQPSRPGSSSSYHHPAPLQSIFQYPHPHNIQTSIPPSFQSPPLPSATSIPEIEVTVAPPTPRTQAFINIESYFPQPYHHQNPHRQGSPSIPPSYIYPQQDPLPALALPSPQGGRRRAVSDSGTRPTFAMMPPTHHNALVRRVSSGSHPYLAVHGDAMGSASSSGRSSPARGHRKSFSHGGHNMTHREVLELVKNDGPREAKNPKKFVCDYPGCGQRFTRNSNKTYPSHKYTWWIDRN